MNRATLAPPTTFFAVPLEHLEPETVLGFDLFLQHGSAEPILYRSKELEYTSAVQERLLGFGVAHLLVPTDQAPQYHAYRRTRGSALDTGAPEPVSGPAPGRVEAEIDGILHDHSLPLRSRATALLGVHRAVVEVALSDLSTPGLHERVQRVAEVTARFLLSEPKAFSSLVGLLASNMDAYHHATRTSLYATELARSIGSRDIGPLVEIGRAALLHDVGRGDLPLEWLHRSGGLSDLDWADVVSHTERGVHLLRTAGFDEPVSVDVVANHHERCDGSGYPQGLRREQVSFHARLVAITDIFDSLTSSGKNHVALSGYQALWRMKHSLNGLFDPELMEHFIRVMVDRPGVR